MTAAGGGDESRGAGDWDGVVRLRERTRLSALVERIGGDVRRDAPGLTRVVPVESAGEGDLAPLLASRYVGEAERALARGASLLADPALAARLPKDAAVWTHAHPTWALAAVLDACDDAQPPAILGDGTTLGANVVLGARVVVGRNVSIGAGSVIGAAGFGWATGPDGRTRRVPQLGGVFIEDDVTLGPLCTIDAGTLSPTRVRRGAKLDAQVHVGHNVEIGEGTIIAAQSGFAGSVRIGRGVLVGGQVGIADHVSVGDGARIAAKSGVIGDVPPGGVVAGYPAVPRSRWLRALARLYRLK
ncbi:MAG: DapH/DapD/GlmU-related protein [Polyangiaceae bacterium]